MKKVIKATHTLSDNKIIYITKGKEYQLQKDINGFYIIDNSGERMTLTPDDIKYRFI